jgi:hypothetical protein
MNSVFKLEADYFADKASHTHLEFRWRFRINKELFIKIFVGVREDDDYLICKKDCVGLLDHDSLWR